jgi:hypothetical protein
MTAGRTSNKAQLLLPHIHATISLSMAERDVSKRMEENSIVATDVYDNYLNTINATISYR